LLLRLLLASELCTRRRLRLAVSAFLAVLLGFPLQGAGAALSLSKDGPKTAREGDLIEYSLEVINEGAASVAGIEVLDTLPAEVQFVQATPTPGGTYNSINGVWTLPTLGTGANDKTAGLQIQVLVNQNLINNPDEVVDITNRAEVIVPLDQTPLEAKVSTNIICSFCINWEIESVTFDYEIDDIDLDDDYDWEVAMRFFLWVKVANNGPVTSDATVSVTRFDVLGIGLGAVTLFPDAPVAVTLDPGQTQTIEFKSGRVEGDDYDFTAFWEFAVSDIALLDPVLPNTASGSYYNDVNGLSDHSEGCFIATAAYGSYLAPYVITLRNFRDRYLLTNPFGEWFVEFYYQHSPPIAGYIRDHQLLRVMVRSLLTVIVYSIQYPIAACLVLLLPPLVVVNRRKQRKNRT